MRVTVIGRGVSGLTTAAELLAAGHEVVIVSADAPLETTSAVAAAVWYPYRAFPFDRVRKWGAVALDRFRSLAEDPSTGVVMRAGVELVPDDEVPWWSENVIEVTRSERDLPPWAQTAWAFTAPVIEMPIFLAWLDSYVQSRGAQVLVRRLERLEDAPASDVVVNCTGLGSRGLIQDRGLRPVRGQVVVVENPGIDTFLLDQESPLGLTYIVPRSRDCVLGGTDDEGSWDLSADAQVAEAIVTRCARYEPRLTEARVIGHKVGLRPARSEVRLEPETLADGRVCIHNYGHGGAGVTLSWGCAADVVGLVEEPDPF
ncbi:MAG: FAD-dependent oxidoreductase [Actinomycetota bacterium]